MAVDKTRYDLLQDGDGDLLFTVAGDLTIGQSDSQHIEDCIIAGPSWWKQYPENGVNIGIYENGSFDRQGLEKLIAVQLGNDGYKSSPIAKFKDGGLYIDPKVIV